MKNFRQTIKMMAMALVSVSTLCSCAAHLTAPETVEPETAEVQVNNTQASVAPAVTAAEKGIRAQAVLRGTQLTFYYDDKDHNTEGKVFEVSSKGYGVKGAPWANSGFVTASFDESCKDWNPTSMVFFFSGCTRVVSIDCTNLNTASVMDMS